VRAVFRYWLMLMLALVLLQIAFAGFAAFDVAEQLGSAGTSVDEESFDDSWGLHTGFGYLILLGGLVTFILALAARVGRQRVLQSLGLFVLLIVQILLAWFGSEVPIIGALHPLNALLILGVNFSLLMREWRPEPMGQPAV
jgi:Family of unknown function (DUF6220)